MRCGLCVRDCPYDTLKLAELGDKTMLATVALASDHNWAGVWIGATLGMVVADGVAIAMFVAAPGGRSVAGALPARVGVGGGLAPGSPGTTLWAIASAGSTKRTM